MILDARKTCRDIVGIYCGICFLLVLLSSPVVKANSPPSFHFGKLRDDADLEYTITWEDSTVEERAVVSFFYSEVENEHARHLIVQDIPLSDVSNIYIWNTAIIAEGRYRLTAVCEVDDTSVEYPFSQLITISHQKKCLDVGSRENVLLNPGFEKGRKHPDSWRVIVPEPDRERSWETSWITVDDRVHSGKRSLRIANIYNGVNSESDWEDRVIVQSSKIELKSENSKYLFSAWVKTKDVEFGHVLFKIKYFGRDGEPLSEKGHRWDIVYGDDSPETDWRQVAYIVNPPQVSQVGKKGKSQPKQVSVSISLDDSPGELLVDDLSFIEISDEEYMLNSPVYNYSAPPIIARNKKVKHSKQGSREFSVQEDSGVWWLVGPDQKRYWSLGPNASANKFLLAKTGLSRREYLESAQYRSKKDLSFNQGWRDKKGRNNYSSLRNNIVWLNFSSEADIEADPEKWVAKDRNNKLISEWGHYFADVFSPIWQEHAISLANSLLDDNGWVIERKHTIGYWTDNEWAYGDMHDFIWGDSSKRAFIDWLQGKNDLPSVNKIFKDMGSRIAVTVPKGFEIERSYADINSLNRAWTSDYHTYKYGSFNDISGTDKPYLRAHDDPVNKDLYAFERLIYKIYVDTVVDNIRRVERIFSTKTGTHHRNLIFSNRFSVNKMASLTEIERSMDIFNRFDIIAVNLYPNYNQLAAYYPYSFLKKIKSTFHEATGRPLYVAEFGLAAEDANNCDQVPCMAVRRWRPNTVESQYQRGWGYNNIISTFANLPFFIGAGWFKWANGYGIPFGSDVRNSGLVDDNDKYYSAFTDNVRSVNKQIENMSRSGSFTLEDIDWSRTKVNICNDVHR